MTPHEQISAQTHSIGPQARSHAREVYADCPCRVLQRMPPLNNDRTVKLTSRRECLREQVNREYIPHVPFAVPLFQLAEGSLHKVALTPVPFNEVFTCAIETLHGIGTSLPMNANFNYRV